MLKLLVVVNIIAHSFASLCQGGFDIEYIPTSSINSSHIGGIFRLDFGSSPVSQKLIDIRLALSVQDSAHVLIHGKTVLVKERRKLYDDMVSYADQFIENVSDKNYCYGKIEDVQLLNIKEDKFIFLAEFIPSKRKKKSAQNSSLEVIVLAKDVAGLLLKTDK